MSVNGTDRGVGASQDVGVVGVAGSHREFQASRPEAERIGTPFGVMVDRAYALIEEQYIGVCPVTRTVVKNCLGQMLALGWVRPPS